MQKELEMWQAENVKHMESLQREERFVNKVDQGLGFEKSIVQKN